MCRFSIKNFDKKQQKKRRKKAHHSYLLHSLFTLLSRHLCALSSRLLRIKRDVYDNYVSRDEEKRTDDGYQEELLFVF